MGMFGARFAVFVRRARVLPSPGPATRNLSFWRFHRHRHPVVSSCCYSTGWCENSTRWKSCKRVRTRGDGAWARLAHALQCLCDGRACCPARAMQLVICRSGGFTGTVTLFQVVVSLEWYGLVRKFHKMEIAQMGTNAWRWCITVSMCT
jgi:hypothetical protein